MTVKPLFAASLLPVAAIPAAALDFNHDVWPVPAQPCFICHGMDEHRRKGRLRLDHHPATGWRKFNR